MRRNPAAGNVLPLKFDSFNFDVKRGLLREREREREMQYTSLKIFSQQDRT